MARGGYQMANSGVSLTHIETAELEILPVISEKYALQEQKAWRSRPVCTITANGTEVIPLVVQGRRKGTNIARGVF